jgi:hypothetical protein
LLVLAKPLRVKPLLQEPGKAKSPLLLKEAGFCGNGWNRTNDTSIFSAVLYQLSYITSSEVPRRLISRWGAQK